MTGTDDLVKFYFSFRSPYAWLGMVRVERALEGLPVELRYHPVFPPADFKNDPTAVPNKAKYILQDIERIGQAYGLAPRPPVGIDTEWMPPHAAYICAADQGKGRQFALALYSMRFERQKDAGDDAVIAEAAEEAGLEPQAVVAAGKDEAYQTRVMEGMIEAATQHDIFGVPYFVYRGETFWGNDRIHWLTRAIRRAHGQSVVDLEQDCLQPLDR